jgi:hypothetical protein
VIFQRHTAVAKRRSPGGRAEAISYLVINPAGGTPFDLAVWQKKTGLDLHGQVVAATREFSAPKWMLRCTRAVTFRKCQGLENSTSAFSKSWENTAHRLPMLGTDDQMKTARTETLTALAPSSGWRQRSKKRICQ